MPDVLLIQVQQERAGSGRAIVAVQHAKLFPCSCLMSNVGSSSAVWDLCGVHLCGVHLVNLTIRVIWNKIRNKLRQFLLCLGAGYMLIRNWASGVFLDWCERCFGERNAEAWIFLSFEEFLFQTITIWIYRFLPCGGMVTYLHSFETEGPVLEQLYTLNSPIK